MAVVLFMIAAAVAVAAGAVVAFGSAASRVCLTYACGPTAVLDLSELADGVIHDAHVRACFDDGVCADGTVPLYLEPLSADVLRAVTITLPMRGARPEAIRLTSLRVVDGQGDVVLDTGADATARTYDARPPIDDCHPECWVAGFALHGGVVVPTRR